MTASGGCDLCGLPTPAEPVTAPDVDGRFCCRGCLEVSRAVGTVDDVSAAAVRDRARGEADARGDTDDRTDHLDDPADDRSSGPT